MDLKLKGKRVVVTGASKGIGLAISRTFAREGAAVYMAARNAERLEAAAATIKSETGAQVATLALDASASDAGARLSSSSSEETSSFSKECCAGSGAARLRRAKAAETPSYGSTRRRSRRATCSGLRRSRRPTSTSTASKNSIKDVVIEAFASNAQDRRDGEERAVTQERRPGVRRQGPA